MGFFQLIKKIVHNNEITHLFHTQFDLNTVSFELEGLVDIQIEKDSILANDVSTVDTKVVNTKAVDTRVVCMRAVRTMAADKKSADKKPVNMKAVAAMTVNMNTVGKKIVCMNNPLRDC